MTEPAAEDPPEASPTVRAAHPPLVRVVGLAAGLVLLAALGTLLGVLPHLLAWLRTGDPSYIADGDELLYRAWSRGAVLRGTWRLEDAVHPNSGPMMHPWLTFVPAGALAHALRLDLNGAAILWRALAGAGVALGLFAATRPALRGDRLALGVAAFLVFDAGLLFGQLTLRETEIVRAIVRGTDSSLFEKNPQIMAHLRVVTPALAIPFLLAHYGLALRARIDRGRRATVAAAVSFGLLFYVYIYFATAVALGGALALALDRRARRLFAIVLAGGIALGLPGVVAGSLTKAGTPPDWLLRTDKFVPVCRLDRAEMLIPVRVIVLWLASGAIVFARRRELTYLWCCTGAALALANEQVVTGRVIENFHWQQAEFLTCSLLTALIAAPWIAGRGGSRLWATALAVALAAQVALGLGLRVREAERTAESLHVTEVDRLARLEPPPLPPGEIVVAGDPDFLFVTAAARADAYPLTGRLVEYSSRATDPELDERLMLNAFLLGVDRPHALALADAPPGTLSREKHALRDPAVADRRRAYRRALVDRIWDDPRRFLEKYRVTHVVLRTPYGPAHFRGLARRISFGSTWDTWQIR